MGLFDVFRTNARPPDPKPEDVPEVVVVPSPEPVLDGQLWRTQNHVCVRPGSHEIGLDMYSAGTIWQCKCGKRHRWVGNGWVSADMYLDDDGDVHLMGTADDAYKGRGKRKP